MAAAGWTLTSLMATAGVSPDQWGEDILLDLPNRSVFMGQGMPPLVDAYSIPEGNLLKAPVIAARTAVARVRGTDDGTALTYGALSGTAVSFTKRAAYNAYAVDWMALNDQPPAFQAATFAGVGQQASYSLANDVDTQILGLYTSALTSVGGGAGVDFTAQTIAEGVKNLEVANAPRPYYAVLPASQVDHLMQSDELTRYDIRGVPSSIATGQGSSAYIPYFTYHGVTIFTTGNVPIAAGASHGLLFSQAGILTVFRTLPTPVVWTDPNTFSDKVLIWMDWAFANSFNDWIVDISLASA